MCIPIAKEIIDKQLLLRHKYIEKLKNDISQIEYFIESTQSLDSEDLLSKKANILYYRQIILKKNQFIIDSNDPKILVNPFLELFSNLIASFPLIEKYSVICYHHFARYLLIEIL
jgi:hypothetical protein